MVLPKAFKLHEIRLSREALDSIEFQFDRLGLDSKDIKIFLDRFLKISQSPTLPPNDLEIVYLASKVAYELSAYDFFKTDFFQDKKDSCDGSQIWYSLSLGAQGEIEKAIKILQEIKHRTEKTGDSLITIETLGVLAQLYFIRGIRDKQKLDEILNEIDAFKEKHQMNLPDFDHYFMSAYLITERIKSINSPPDEIIEEIETLIKKAKTIEDYYWITHFKIDLVIANLKNNALDLAEKKLNEIQSIFEDFTFPALEAKKDRINGEFLKKKNNFSEAEKSLINAKNKYQKLKDQIGVSACVSKLANLAFQQNNIDKAEQYYTESYTISEKMNDFYGMAISLSALGKIASNKNQYAEALATFQKALEIIEDNNFDYLLPEVNDGLSFIFFITGDFLSAIHAKKRSFEIKTKFSYPKEHLLIEHMKLGQLNALVENFEDAFREFEMAMNYCVKLERKDEIYFDILNWLFEISTVLNKIKLAETYVSRADLFASIHNSAEENVQASISRIRFLIQKRDLENAEKRLELIFEKTLDFPSALTMALALVAKAMIFLLKLDGDKDDTLKESLIQTIEDMVFISLDLEFLPLTMYAKMVLSRILALSDKFQDAIEEIEEAIELAVELGMQKFEDVMKDEDEKLKSLQAKSEELTLEEKKKYNEELYNSSLELLRQTFWLVSSSEHQKI